MRRARRRGRQQNLLQNDDALTFKPLNDPPSTSVQQNAAEPTLQKSPKNERNPRCVSGNRRGHVAKLKSVKKNQSNEEDFDLLNDESGSFSIVEEAEDDKQNNEEGLVSNNDDVERILRELSSGFEEPLLEAEQLRINDQYRRMRLI